VNQARYVQALLREREGYVLRGRESRVADVDAELERLGVPGPGPMETTEAEPPPERSVPERPQRPTRPGKP